MTTGLKVSSDLRMTPAGGEIMTSPARNSEPSGLRVCDKGKMEAARDQYFSLYEAIGIKYPSFCSHKERANISIKSQSASLAHTDPEAPCQLSRGTQLFLFSFLITLF